jgi:hypothetical protein
MAAIPKAVTGAAADGAAGFLMETLEGMKPM